MAKTRLAAGGLREVAGLPPAYLDARDDRRGVCRGEAQSAGRHGEPFPGAASIIGELRHQVPARYAGHEFSIGSPYPDRYPEHLAGGILFINQQTFESATLTTFDGNDYFAISIKTRSMEILVQDDASGFP